MLMVRVEGREPSQHLTVTPLQPVDFRYVAADEFFLLFGGEAVEDAFEGLVGVEAYGADVGEVGAPHHAVGADVTDCVPAEGVVDHAVPHAFA